MWDVFIEEETMKYLVWAVYTLSRAKWNLKKIFFGEKLKQSGGKKVNHADHDYPQLSSSKSEHMLSKYLILNQSVEKGIHEYQYQVSWLI